MSFLSKVQKGMERVEGFLRESTVLHPPNGESTEEERGEKRVVVPKDFEHCSYPPCCNQASIRHLCQRHYQQLYQAVREREISDQDLARAGLGAGDFSFPESGKTSRQQLVSWIQERIKQRETSHAA